MLRAILNKSWKQHPTRHQLYGHLPPIMKTIKVRRTRHAGHCWRSRDELISHVLQWTSHMAVQKQDNQLEPTYSSSVRILDVPWGPARSDERKGGVAWEGQGYPCWRHDMMMMMTVVIFGVTNNGIKKTQRRVIYIYTKNWRKDKWESYLRNEIILQGLIKRIHVKSR